MISSAETTNLPHQPPQAFSPTLYDSQDNKAPKGPVDY